MLRKVLLWFAGSIGVLLVGFAIFVAARQELRFDAPYPDITASTDSAVIARGHYVVRVISPCAGCHGAPGDRAANMQGAEVPLSGGMDFDIPPGRWYVRNITPDSATGLGAVSDQAIARALRFGVGHDGRALLPFMEVQGLADDDLRAIISYLRTQAPVHNPIPPHSYTLLGRVVRATALANPVGPSETPPAVAPRGATVENGRYLAESVSLCWACHTDRSQATGAMIGPRYAGTSGFTESYDPTTSWSPPNITSDPQTGRVGQWSEDDFVARFRKGRLLPDSPMPWQAYQRMDEDDLRAIYRFLKSVPPVSRDMGPPFVKVAAN